MLTPEQIADVVAAWKTDYLVNMTTARRGKGQDTFLPVELKEQQLKGNLPLNTKEITKTIIESYANQREQFNELILTNSFGKMIQLAKSLLRQKRLRR